MEQLEHSPRTAGRPASAAAQDHRLILAFSLAFIVFMILPTFLSAQLQIFPLMKIEDAFTLLTPLVLIPLYWLLLKQAAMERVAATTMVLFLVLSGLWADGHGIHMAANSISHLLDEANGGDTGRLTYFYDEVLGHYLWHIGFMGLTVLLVAVEWPNPTLASANSVWPLGIAGFIYGLTFFLIVDEGQTTLVGVPFAVLFSVVGFAWGHRKLRSHPLLLFFLVSYLVACLLFAAWGIYWGGLPEFSKVGFIK
jgi:hypothetical protein